MQTRAAIDNTAEREGFEPSNTFWDVTHFPGERLRPLGHLSILNLLQPPGGIARGGRRSSSASLRTDASAATTRPPLHAAARVPEVIQAIKSTAARVRAQPRGARRTAAIEG